MEVKKGQNILEHEAEIYSRPARTWFQSGRDKQQSEGASHGPRLFLDQPIAKSAISKRQYENSFQNSKSAGSKAQAEKVLFPDATKGTR
jgi:ATP-dependent RNA helicase DDX27